MKIRLHMPAIPHTITRDEFSHCAFTGKVKRFAPMMRSRGFEVYHYGVETSESGADKEIQLLTKQEWELLRIESCKMIHPDLPEEEIINKLQDPKAYVGNLGNVQYPIYKVFNARFREELKKHYRSTSTDIVCLPFGPANEEATNGLDVVCVESGIGYPNAFKNFRIYESYAKLHMNMQRDGKSLENYWFVCPNYFDVREWPLSLTPKRDTFGYFGRLEHIKGVSIVVEVALKFPHVQFILCGQGDPTPFLTAPNIVYKMPIHGKERGEYLGSLTALLAPSKWPEPFCGVSAEAQLCGTPVIGHDCGAIVENVENFKTGVRCHTLSDFCYATQMALDGKFDRQYIRNRALDLFDMYNIAKKYDHAFKSILDIFNGTNGWYSPNIHIDALDPNVEDKPIPIENNEVSDQLDMVPFNDKFQYIPEDYNYKNIIAKNIIPRLIHLLWVGDSPEPEHFYKNVDIWHKLMPSWEIHVWLNKDINTTEFPEEIVNLLNTVTSGIQKADIMKYFILEKYGGLYVDAGMIPNISLEPLITNFGSTELIVYHDSIMIENYVHTNFIGISKNHPIMKKASDLCYNVEVNTLDRHLKTGPGLFGKAIGLSAIHNEKVSIMKKNPFIRSKVFMDEFNV